MNNERYNILIRGKRVYSSLSEKEYFDRMEDLSVEFYQTGSPSPKEIQTEIIVENHQWLQNQKLV